MRSLVILNLLHYEQEHIMLLLMHIENNKNIINNILNSNSVFFIITESQLDVKSTAHAHRWWSA